MKLEGIAAVDAGVTGLATLAFLGAGHTERAGKFKKTVRTAVEWLMFTSKTSTRAWRDGSVRAIWISVRR